MDIEKTRSITLELNAESAEFDMELAQEKLKHTKIIRDAFRARMKKIDDQVEDAIQNAESRIADWRFADAIYRIQKERNEQESKLRSDIQNLSDKMTLTKLIGLNDLSEREVQFLGKIQTLLRQALNGQ